MLPDQQAYILAQLGGGLQPKQDLIGHIRAELGMAVEMSLAGFIQLKGAGFADVMQQRCPSKRQLPGDISRDLGGVGLYIVDMVRRMLRKSNSRGKLRDHPAQDRREAQQILRGDQQEKFT